MKKLGLICVAFATSVVMAFAQEAPAAAPASPFSAEGGVYFDFGSDLDYQSSGLVLGLDNLRFKANVTEPTTLEKGAESGDSIYGDIKIAGLRIGTDNDTSHSDTYISDKAKTDWGATDQKYKRPLYLLWDQLQAKIVLGPDMNLTFLYNNYNNFHHALQLTTYNGDGYYLKNAYDYQFFNGTYGTKNGAGSLYNGWELIGPDKKPTNQVFFKASNYAYHDHVTNDSYLTLDYTLPQIVKLTAAVASYKAFGDTTRFTDSYSIAARNAYAVNLGASLKMVPNLIAIAAASFDVGTPDLGATESAVEYSPLAFSGKLGYKVSFNDDFAVVPQAAFDCQLPNIDGYGGAVTATRLFSYAAASGVEIDFMKSIITLNAGFSSAATTTAPTVYGLRSTLAAYVPTIDKLTLKGAVEYIDDNLDHDTNKDGKVDSFDVISWTIGAGLEAAYDIPVSAKGVLTPFVKVSSDTKRNPNAWNLTNSGIPLYTKAGATLAGFVTNTKFELTWNSNDLSNVENATKDKKLGDVVLRTTISF